MNKQFKTVKIYLGLAIGLCFTLASCGGGTYGTGADTTLVKEIKGIIKEENGQPVKDVQVTIDKENVTAKTQANGEFSLTIDRNLSTSVVISLISSSLNTAVTAKLPSEENIFLQIIVNIDKNRVSEVIAENNKDSNSEGTQRDDNNGTPIVCSAEYDPICGVDGNTYGNLCEATRANISLAYRGECNSNPNIIYGDNCGADYTPVCGIDGKTYPNACSATSNNVSIAFTGECPSNSRQCEDSSAGPVCGVNGVTYDSECASLIAGVQVSFHGVCANNSNSQICPAVYEPVCGKDNKTYGNTCEAAAASIAVAYSGPCQ